MERKGDKLSVNEGPIPQSKNAAILKSKDLNPVIQRAVKRLAAWQKSCLSPRRDGSAY